MRSIQKSKCCSSFTLQCYLIIKKVAQENKSLNHSHSKTILINKAYISKKKQAADSDGLNLNEPI